MSAGSGRPATPGRTLPGAHLEGQALAAQLVQAGLRIERACQGSAHDRPARAAVVKEGSQRFLNVPPLSILRAANFHWTDALRRHVRPVTATRPSDSAPLEKITPDNVLLSDQRRGCPDLLVHGPLQRAVHRRNQVQRPLRARDSRPASSATTAFNTARFSPSNWRGKPGDSQGAQEIMVAPEHWRGDGSGLRIALADRDIEARGADLLVNWSRSTGEGHQHMRARADIEG